MKAPPFYLTRQAGLDLRAIYHHSQKQWGDATAQNYMAKIYATFHKIAKDPEMGRSRKIRAEPFFMVPAAQHFVVYDVMDLRPVILTVLHQNRNIEQIIAGLTPEFLQEVVALRTAGQGHV
jgi:toxin ParE1/3/4